MRERIRAVSVRPTLGRARVERKMLARVFLVSSFLGVGVFLVGCGPSLHAEVKTARAFKVSADCAQGPFVIHTTALGSPWGEDMTLATRGGGVSGHVTVTVGSDTQENRVAGGDNHACLLSDSERGAAATAVTPPASDGSGSTPPSGGTPPPGGQPPATTTSAAPTLNELPMNLVADLPQAMLVAQIHREVNKIEDKALVLPKGTDIKIEFWSEQPNDFSRTYFVLTQSAMVPPDGNDAKWQAHLDELRADDERKAREAAAEAKKQQEEAEARDRERVRCSALMAPDAKCHDEGFKTGSELQAEANEDQRCNALALRNATDEKCRAIGWRNDNERPDYLSHPAPPPPPPATMTTTVPSGPQKHDPDRPPPAPQVEVQTPKPSEHADWVPGSWQWNGFDWVWLAGGWRVPESDRQQKLTATAPAAPPAAQVEVRPAQPVATAVWVDGYWHYQGGRWVWVAGRWAVPPRAGATWRPSVWVPDGVHVRLDPGGWVVR